MNSRDIHRTTSRQTIPLMIFLVLTMICLPAAANEGVLLRGSNSPAGSHGSFGIMLAGGAVHLSPPNEDGDQLFLFDNEPRVLKIFAGGPADGILHNGDWIVAIDGLPITSEDAGWMLQHPLIGRTYELTIRRGERERTVTLTGGEPDTSRANDNTIEVVTEAEDGTLQVTSYSMNEVGAVTNVAERASSSSSDTSTPGWFGLGLESGYIQVIREGEDVNYIYFDELPKVYKVDPDGPADEAGIRRGDVLVKVDGRRLDEDEGGRRWSTIEPGEDVELLVMRNGEIRSVQLEADEHPAVVTSRPDNRYFLVGSTLDDTDHLRWAGTISDVDVDVRGLSDVSVTKSSDELLIKTGDTTIRLSVRDE